jgi:hypothetical protein
MKDLVLPGYYNPLNESLEEWAYSRVHRYAVVYCLVLHPILSRPSLKSSFPL